jgi:hypothetical protein
VLARAVTGISMRHPVHSPLGVTHGINDVTTLETDRQGGSGSTALRATSLVVDNVRRLLGKLLERGAQERRP